MSTVNSSSTSNIQHVNPYSLAMSSQYVVPPQDKLMNEKIGYDGDNDLANFYKFLAAPYANAPVHNSASYFTPNSIRINENSERCANGNTHDSASYVTTNSSRINESSAKCKKAIACDLALYATSSSSQIDENSAHATYPYGSSKWKRPAYYRPYPLHFDYLEAPDGWWVPDFYEFSGEDSKTAVEHISLYLSQLGDKGMEDFMRIQNCPLSPTGIAFAWFTSLPECTIDLWSKLEEQFYEYFEKTNVKKSITTTESSTKRGLLVDTIGIIVGYKQMFGCQSRTTQYPFRINHISRKKSCCRKTSEAQ